MSLSDGKAVVGTERKQMTLPKKGPRAAVLTGIIDLGIQEQEFRGKKKKPRREFVPIFTLINDTYETDEGETRHCKLSPYGVKHLPGASMGKYFDFYNALDPNHEVLNDKGEGNVLALIGKTCLVNVRHSDPKDDKEGFVYPRMEGISELPEDYPVDVPEFDPIIFNLDEPSKEVFDNLYEFTQNRIRASIGYPGSAAEGILDGDDAGKDPDAVQDQKQDEEEEGDEDAPY